MNEADSKPVSAKAMVDQNTRFLTPSPGVSDSGVNRVAGPKRTQATRPMAMRASAAAHRASAPMLLIHFPNCTPRRFGTVPSARPTSAAMMT